jgi:hypothetical protein
MLLEAGPAAQPYTPFLFNQDFDAMPARASLSHGPLVGYARDAQKGGRDMPGGMGGVDDICCDLYGT